MNASFHAGRQNEPSRLRPLERAISVFMYASRRICNEIVQSGRRYGLRISATSDYNLHFMLFRRNYFAAVPSWSPGPIRPHFFWKNHDLLQRIGMIPIVTPTAIAIDQIRSLQLPVSAHNIFRRIARRCIFHEQDDSSLARVSGNRPCIEQEGRFHRMAPRHKSLQWVFKKAGELHPVKDLYTVSPRDGDCPFSLPVVANALLECSVGVDPGGPNQMPQRGHPGHVGEYGRNVVQMVERDQWRNWVSSKKTE